MDTGFGGSHVVLRHCRRNIGQLYVGRPGGREDQVAVGRLRLVRGYCPVRGGRLGSAVATDMSASVGWFRTAEVGGSALIIAAIAVVVADRFSASRERPTGELEPAAAPIMEVIAI